jgi:choline-sulfatase/glucosamine-6-phosphate deaminase
MNLRVFLLFCGLCSAALAVEKPNIVFLLTDDQTIGALGCSGNPDVITPHLDKLASDGVHF